MKKHKRLVDAIKLIGEIERLSEYLSKILEIKDYPPDLDNYKIIFEVVQEKAKQAKELVYQEFHEARSAPEYFVPLPKESLISSFESQQDDENLEPFDEEDFLKEFNENKTK